MTEVVVKSLADMELGATSSYRTVVTQQMIDDYARVSGDFSPLHVDAEYAASTRFGTTLAHGLLTASFIQVPLTDLVAPGGVSVSYAFDLLAPVPAGTEVEATATCRAVDPGRSRAEFRVCVRDVSGGGHEVVSGKAEIAFPRGRKKQEGDT